MEPKKRGRKKIYEKTLTVRISERHNIMVKKLAIRDGKGEGAVVREAIEEKFKKEA